MFLHWSDRQCAFGGFRVPGSEATRQPLCLVDGKVKLFLSYFQRICPCCRSTPVACAPADGSPQVAETGRRSWHGGARQQPLNRYSRPPKGPGHLSRRNGKNPVSVFFISGQCRKRLYWKPHVSSIFPLTLSHLRSACHLAGRGAYI